MKNSILAKWGAIYAFGVLVYIFLLASFFSKANDLFGKADHSIVSPMAALMLLVFSALVTGGLVLGKPIMLYLDGQKKDGVKLLFFTGGSMFIFMSLIFIILLMMK